ncbi:hypothetical protein [Streptomyces longwoodensis]|uniref:hypothetical protein n=1 Tax=Streptomyces longwoodensis TaxID=68231 RepID=UPI0038274E98
MDRQQILDLYEWRTGICFRHPAKGEVPTTVVGTVHPRAGGERPVLGCADCVIAIEDMRREEAARAGEEYVPGQVDKAAG